MSETNKCYMCFRYVRYYTKEATEFRKTKFGWCSAKQAVIVTQDGCEKFRCRIRSARNEKLLKYHLNDLLTEITEIRKLLQADATDEEL